MLENSGFNTINSPFIFKSLNLPGYKISFDKPILVNFSEMDYETGDYSFKKAIVGGIGGTRTHNPFGNGF